MYFLEQQIPNFFERDPNLSVVNTTNSVWKK